MSGIKPCDRVMTATRGAGTVVELEYCNDAYPGAPVRMVCTGRWAVKLDHCDNPCLKDGVGYFHDNELQLLHGESK